MLQAKGLFPTDAIFRAVFDGLTDIFVCITIQGTNLHIACVIDLECMGSDFHADFTEDTAS
jgi:hypothetical protein